MFYSMKHLPSIDEAKILKNQLFEKGIESLGERKNRIKELLRNGEISLRGLYNEDELAFLIEIIESGTDMKGKAAEAIAFFIHHSPYVIFK